MWFLHLSWDAIQPRCGTRSAIAMFWSGSEAEPKRTPTALPIPARLFRRCLFSPCLFWPYLFWPELNGFRPFASLIGFGFERDAHALRQVLQA